MNCLIVYPDELGSDGVVRLIGDRARRALERHGLTVGANVTAGLRFGGLGRATVVSVAVEDVHLTFEHQRPAPPRFPAELIVAVPRPQTVKKIVHLAVTLGLTHLHLVRTLKTVKSYLASSVLFPESLESEVLEGLEQGVDTVSPEIAIYPSFENFGAGALREIAARAVHRHIADTHAPTVPMGTVLSAGSLALAIGPEGGWTELERTTFAAAGFAPLGLGARMLRVEVAAALALGQFGALSPQTKV